MKTQVKEYISTLNQVLTNLKEEEILQVANAFKECRDQNKTIYVFGNGGSGSTASHMVCDIVKGCSYKKENKYKVICLNDNIPTILAYSNDVSYDEVFVEQLKNFLSKGDLVLGISGSGNSVNIIKAIEYANNRGNTTIGFTGFDGGKLKSIAKISFNASVNDMQHSEDVHMIGVHILYSLLFND